MAIKEEKKKVPTVKSKVKIKAKAEKEAVVKIEPEKTEKAEKKLTYIFSVGRRKTAVARVRLYPKDTRGNILINNKDYREYFANFEFQKVVEEPLRKVNLFDKYYISIKVNGGGKHGQAEAVRHGIARALLKFDESFKKSLRSEGFLTRDSRRKERKKPGLKRARRAPQFSKR